MKLAGRFEREMILVRDFRRSRTGPDSTVSMKGGSPVACFGQRGVKRKGSLRTRGQGALGTASGRGGSNNSPAQMSGKSTASKVRRADRFTLRGVL